MNYRKFSADQLFDGYTLLGSEKVLVLKPDNSVDAVVSIDEAGEGIETLNGILSPGFVNCHCHLELSHMKGRIAKQSGMVPFLQQVMQQRQGLDAEIFEAANNADKDLYNSGVVAVADICNTVHSIRVKQNSRIKFHNLIEATGFVPATADTRFEQSLRDFNAFESAFPGQNSIVPHAPYSVSIELMKLITSFKTNRLFSIHNQESGAENEFFENGSGDFLNLFKSLNLDISFFKAPGKRSLPARLNEFPTNIPLLLVHDVTSSADDLKNCEETGILGNIHWCLCPNANLYISNQLPDIAVLKNSSSQLVLGTDSLASNDRLDLLSEIETILSHFPFISLAEALGWATLNGAKALQMEDVLGSFETGKKPGLVLMDPELKASRRIV